MNLHDEIERLQHTINSLQSLAGYDGAEPHSSGEIGAIEYILSEKPQSKIIFDVGSHTGEYVLLMRGLFPGLQFHCFEPDPISFEILKKNVAERFGADSGIILNNEAIAENTRSMTLYSHILGGAGSSLHKLDLEHHNVKFELETQVKATTIQRYCELNGIRKIDFLKMDIEGYEYTVLNSMFGFLEENRVEFIQIEYGSANIDTRVFLKDFYKLLRRKYNFYRIHPRGLYPCNDYREDFECFKLTNYLLERYC